MGFLFPLLVHLAAIAALFPELAAKTASLWDATIVLQFPLMALAVVAHSIWADEDDVLRSRVARLSLTFGITYVCLLLFVVFGISVGPADPFGAPPDASLAMRAAWFAGFTLIASMGSRFFIASSVLDIGKALAGPMRARPRPWCAGALVGGALLGGCALALLKSDLVQGLAADSQAALDANPAPYVIGFIAVPLILGGLAKSLRKD